MRSQDIYCGILACAAFWCSVLVGACSRNQAGLTAAIQAGTPSRRFRVDITDTVKLKAPAHVVQGDTVKIFLFNADPAHPFDSTLTLDPGKDMAAQVAEVSATTLTVAVSAGFSAAKGPHDLTIQLGSDGLAIVKGAVIVDELPTPRLVPKTDNELPVAKGRDRTVLRIAGLGGKLLDVRVVTNGLTKPPRTALALIDPAKGFGSPLGVSFSGELVAALSAPDEALLHVILLDAPFLGRGERRLDLDTDRTVVVNGDLVAPTLAREVEPNGDFMTANPVTAPVLVTAALSKKSDVDVFRLTVTSGTLVVRTLPDESVKSKYATDTKVDILDSNQKLLSSNDDEQPNSPFSLATATVSAGTVFVRVSSGADAFTDGGAYKLAALVH